MAVGDCALRASEECFWGDSWDGPGSLTADDTSSEEYEGGGSSSKEP